MQFLWAWQIWGSLTLTCVLPYFMFFFNVCYESRGLRFLVLFSLYQSTAFQSQIFYSIYTNFIISATGNRISSTSHSCSQSSGGNHVLLNLLQDVFCVFFFLLLEARCVLRGDWCWPLLLIKPNISLFTKPLSILWNFLWNFLENMQLFLFHAWMLLF